jgi:hypothetical protein
MEHEAIAPPCALADVYEMARSGQPFRASVWPEDVEDLHWLETFAASRPNIAFALDEYSIWYPTANHLPSNGLLALVRCGRKLKQDVYLTTQSPGAITKQIVGQSSVWVLQLQEPNDIKYVLERTGGLVDPSTLYPLEMDGERIVKTRLALYSEGKRTDYVLDTPTATIEPAGIPAENPLDIPLEDAQNANGDEEESEGSIPIERG